jgi:hypothetical protein
MAQVWLESFRIWFIPYFLWGILFFIVISIITKIILRVQRRYMQHRTDEAGVPRIVIPVRDWPKGWSVADIEGAIWCIGLLIIAILVPILAFFGFTFPVTLPEEMQDLIGATFAVAIGALFWGGGLVGLLVSIYDFRKRHRQLKEAVAGHT